MILDPLNTSKQSTGRLFVISGPSGVGKGTLVDAVVGALPNIALSISATTRAPRDGDVDGLNYHFKTDNEFDELIANDGVLEWAEVHGKRYGTLTEEVQKALAEGKDLILEIDPQGNDQVKRLIPDSFSVFIAPPSLEELRKRLELRGTEDLASIERRLRTAEVEMDQQDRYNAVVVNNDLDTAIEELTDIINNNRDYTTST